MKTETVLLVAAIAVVGVIAYKAIGQPRQMSQPSDVSAIAGASGKLFDALGKIFGDTSTPASSSSSTTADRLANPFNGIYRPNQ